MVIGMLKCKRCDSRVGRLFWRLACWLRCLIARGTADESGELKSRLAKISEVDCRGFPVAACRLRVLILHALAHEGNVAQFDEVLPGLIKPRFVLSRNGALLAECVGRAIAACLKHGSADAIEQAKRLFSAFRAISSRLVREAFPLVVELARRKQTDDIAARMYMEYVACSGIATSLEDYRLVRDMDLRCFELALSSARATKIQGVR